VFDGFSELPLNDSMVARLAQQVNVNQQILNVNGQLDPVLFFRSTHPLGFSHLHQNEPRLKLPALIRAWLFATFCTVLKKIRSPARAGE
jgi:hypothetical protein